MPTINDYTFSDVQFTVPENSFISDTSLTAVITISPLAGYTATAADFSLEQGFSNQYVQSVTFTQDGNNVLCTVTFVTSAVMPSANVTIPLCVVGSANPMEVIIDGALDVDVGPNVTGNNSVKYNDSGLQGESELLFTVAYTSDSGYYLMATGIQVTEGNQSNYNIVQTPTYDTDNRLVGISYDVNYIYPPQDVEGDLLELKVVAREIYNPLPKISGYIFDTSALGNPEQTRTLTVLGIPDTPFSATLNDGTTTTTIINNEIIGSKGTYNHDITFPALIKGSSNVTYTIEITGSYVADINLPNPFTVEQLDAAQIIIGKVSNVPVPVSGWPPTDPLTIIPALLPSPFEDITNSSGIWLIELDYNLLPFTGAGTFSVAKETIDNEDFTNFGINQKQSASNQTNVTSLQLNNTTDISSGDFGVLDGENAPYLFEVISVDSSTNLTISPAITVVNNQFINFYKDEGNKINAYNSSVTKNSDGSIKVYAKIAITHSGIAGKTFDLDLSNIITHNPPTAFGMTGTHATNTAACADTSYTNTVYVTNDEFEQGKTVYTNYNSVGNGFNTPFVGNSGFYAVDINPKIAIKIDSNGVIIDAIHLCV